MSHGEPKDVKLATAKTSQTGVISRGSSSGRDGTPLSSLTSTIDLGPTLDRYIILERIGSGGMGVVICAYDPKLDRRVAIKLLHRSCDSSAQARLYREAQVMAALNHPNVVSIFDMGIVELAEGQMLFIAMEYIEGQTLTEWLKAQPRTQAEILSVFIAAGRGLAAAHDAGLVHRDFKPSNVMVSRDRRVLVLDFGLARTAQPTVTSSTTAENLRAASSLGLEPVTRTDVVVGTPAYMAPEQHMLRGFDHRCDQYSFCVALWEALCGVRPFSGDTIHALLLAKLQVQVSTPPALRTQVSVHRALIRGLAPNASDRFPDMATLLALLQDVQDRPQRRRAISVVAFVLTVGLSVYGYLGTTDKVVCQGVTERLDGIWDPQTKIRVQAAIAGVEVAYALDTWQRVRPMLDDYSARWGTAYTDACNATRIQRTQSESAMDLRMRCLDNRLHHLDALIGTLAAADVEVVQRAVQAIKNLPTIDACIDPDDPQTQPPLPDDPQMRAFVGKLRAELTQAAVYQQTGQYQRALELMLDIEDQAQSTGYEPLLAEVALARGIAHYHTRNSTQAMASLRTAYFTASAWGLDTIAANAASHYIQVAGTAQGQQQFSLERWINHAVSVAERSKDELTWANLLNNIGIAYGSHGDHRRSLDYFRRALTNFERNVGPTHIATASVISHIGIAHFGQSEFEQALESYHRALTIFEQNLGHRHPDVGKTLNNISSVYSEQRKLDLALRFARRALTVFEQPSGLQHPYTAEVLSNVGIVYNRKGDLPRALDYLQRALVIFEQTLGLQHPKTATCLGYIGAVYNAQGDDEHALKSLHRAVDIFEQTIGPKSPTTAIYWGNIGVIYENRGDDMRALEYYRRAMKTLEQTAGPSNPMTIHIYYNIGLIQLRQGDHEAAIASFERTVSGYTKANSPPESRGKAAFALARALTQAHRDLPRARTLAQAAREEFLTAEGDHQEAITKIDAWLAKYRD